MPLEEYPGARNMRSQASPSNPPVSAQRLFNETRQQILNVRSSTEIVLECIEITIGNQVVRSLIEDPAIERLSARFTFNPVTKTIRIRVMPTLLHDAHHKWWHDECTLAAMAGFFTAQEVRFLDVGVGTTFKDFSGTYNSAIKQPDLYVRPDNQDFPSLIIEAGWSESWRCLRDDVRLWLIGGAPDVRTAIAIRWSKLVNNRVKGELKVYKRSTVAALGYVAVQEEVVFPAPANSQNQCVELRRSDLFGSRVLPRRNGNDIFRMSLNELRLVASLRMQTMGFTPA